MSLTQQNATQQMQLFADICYNCVFPAQYLIQQGVVAIVGPMRSSDVKYTQPYFSGFHIPQFAPVATDPTFTSTPANFPYLVRMSPSDTIQCQALAGIMKHYNWSQFALLVSKDNYGVLILKLLLIHKSLNSTQPKLLIVLHHF